MVHGDRDRLVNFSQSAWLVQDLQAKGQDVAFYRPAPTTVAPFLKEHLT